MWKACGRQELLCETGASSGGAGGARAETPPCVVGAKAPDARAQPGTGWHPRTLTPWLKGRPYILGS